MQGLADHSSAVRAAQASLEEHLEAIEACKRKVVRLQQKITKDQIAFDKLVEQISDRNVAATLADEPLPAEDPSERRRLQALTAAVAAAQSAIPQINHEIAYLGKLTTDYRHRLADAFWPWKADVLARETERVKVAFAQAALPLARLAAMETLQSFLIGERFVTSSAAQAVTLSTGRLVDKVLKGLPDAVTPPELGADFANTVSTALQDFRTSLSEISA